MSRRRRQGLSPSLFPFLAVLVCTLGTLILLLALVAENATAAAEQKARAQQRAQAKQTVADASATRMTRESVETLLREEEFRVTELVAVRDKQTSELESRRDELTHIDDHIERLRKQIKQLHDEVRQATGELEAPLVSDTAIAELKELIESERKTVKKLREEAADLSPRVVIVPHKGPNGTDRRPVYLECTADGITIWPEGSRITMEQLENVSYSANPLDAALRTIRMHVMQNYGDSIPPYPLLVVRPDGIESYGAARRAMQDWDDQFGYELVPAEVKLAFSQPDPNLKSRLEIAINTAVAEQRVRVAMTQRSIGRGGALGDSAYGNGKSSGKGLPVLSAAALDRAGRASGFGQLRDDYRAGDYRGSSSSAIAATPYTQGPQIGSAGGSSYPGSASDVNDAGAAARRMAEQMQTAAQEMRSEGTRNGSQGLPTPSGTSSGLSSPLGKHFADLSPAGGTDNVAGTPDSSSTESLSGNQGEFENQGAATRDALANQASGAQDGNAFESSQGSSGEGALSRTASSLGAGGSGPSAQANATAPTGNPQDSQQAQAMQSQAMQGSAQMQGSPSTMGSPVTTMDERLAADPRLQAQMEKMQPGTQSPSMASASLVQRQGRDWALPSSMAGMHGNAIVRTMRVQCYPDRFVLLSAKNEGATEVFGFFDGDVNRATLELATTLRDRIEKWGPALPGGRWQPRLEVQITPQSEMRFHQLRTLMNGSGIELVGKVSP